MITGIINKIFALHLTCNTFEMACFNVCCVWVLFGTDVMNAMMFDEGKIAFECSTFKNGVLVCI